MPPEEEEEEEEEDTACFVATNSSTTSPSASPPTTQTDLRSWWKEKKAYTRDPKPLPMTKTCQNNLLPTHLTRTRKTFLWFSPRNQRGTRERPAACARIEEEGRLWVWSTTPPKLFFVTPILISPPSRDENNKQETGDCNAALLLLLLLNADSDDCTFEAQLLLLHPWLSHAAAAATTPVPVVV